MTQPRWGHVYCLDRDNGWPVEHWGQISNDRKSSRRLYLLLFLISVFLSILLTLLPSLGSSTIMIDGLVRYEDQSITLNDNVSVVEGGNLILVNTTMIFNCTFPLQYGMTVEHGGRLVILDGDDNRYTTEDSSAIKGEDVFFAHIEEGGYIEVRNSIISRCGPETVTQWDQGGIVINASVFTIDGTQFTDSGMGLFLQRITDGAVMNCSFQGLGIGISGFFGSELHHLSITKCTFKNMTNAIDLYTTQIHNHIEIIGNAFEGISKEVIMVDDTRNLLIEQNSFTDNGYSGISLTGEARYGRVSSNTSILYNSFESVGFPIILKDVNDVRIEGCTFRDFTSAISMWPMHSVYDFDFSLNSFILGSTAIDIIGERIVNATIYNNDITRVTNGITTGGGPR